VTVRIRTVTLFWHRLIAKVTVVTVVTVVLFSRLKRGGEGEKRREEKRREEKSM